MSEFDAFLLLSYGGPEGPDDVLPFLHNVTRGSGTPDEALDEIAERYRRFGGVSPINARNRELLAALHADFAANGVGLPIYWGNRNWKPFLAEAVRAMRDDGVHRALVLTTSATGGYFACRQYRENLTQAHAVAGDGAPDLVKLRHYFDHPGYIAANLDGARAALDSLPAKERDGARLVFTAHSVPVAMNDSSGVEGGLYARQQRETARLVATLLRGEGAEFDLVWQSRTGPAEVPWLEPDIDDHLRMLAGSGVTAVVICPTGFVADSAEVLWGLDTQARQTADELGLHLARAAAANAHPAFVTAIRELVLEQVRGDAPKLLSSLGVCGWECPEGCCRPARRSADSASPQRAL